MLLFCHTGSGVEAVPVPKPTPVAVNVVPTLLSAAPINVKIVVPVETIIYVLAVTNAPAVITGPVKVYCNKWPGATVF